MRKRQIKVDVRSILRERVLAGLAGRPSSLKNGSDSYFNLVFSLFLHRNTLKEAFTGGDIPWESPKLEKMWAPNWKKCEWPFLTFPPHAVQGYPASRLSCIQTPNPRWRFTFCSDPETQALLEPNELIICMQGDFDMAIHILIVPGPKKPPKD